MIAAATRATGWREQNSAYHHGDHDASELAPGRRALVPRRSVAAGQPVPLPVPLPFAGSPLPGVWSTLLPGGTERTTQTLPPMTEPLPMRIRPRMVAPA